MTEREFVAQNRGPSVEMSAESLRLLGDPLFRQEVLREIQRNPSLDASGLLRELLRMEVEYRRSDRNDGAFFENIYWCAFLLWRVGDLGDVMLLWRAKHTNFDTGCGLDIQFLMGAGVDETISYLQRQTDVDSRDALEYILKCKAAGDFDNLEGWASWRAKYFDAPPREAPRRRRNRSAAE